MKLLKYILTVLLVGLFFTGCIPKIKAKFPLVSGQVVDVLTKKPISGVVISSTIKTSEEGKFLIPKESELGIATTMGGIYRIEKTFSLSKEGYIPLVCTCSVLVNSAECRDEIIKMTKVGQEKETPFRLHVKNRNYGLYCYE